MITNPPLPPPIKQRKQKQGPLSYSQESIWFLQQLDPGNNAYNLNYLYRFKGGIDQPSLERALNEMVRRHEPLRTLYPNQGGKPVQVIKPFESFPLPCLDFSELKDDDRLQAIRTYSSEHSNQPYDLQRGPLMRCALLQSGPNEEYLFFGTHHIGFDGWSRQIFFSELMQLYDAFKSGKAPILPDLPIQYADYTLWQREWLSGETLSVYIDHWKKILSGDLPVLELPTDRPRPSLQTYHGAKYHFIPSQTISSQMKEFCQKERITTFHLLLAAYVLLLMRYTGQEDIIVGCPFANRVNPELDGLAGMFVNTLPIRVNMSGNPSVRELLEQVRSVMLDALIWQAAPFEAVVSKISLERNLSRSPVFQVAINLRNVPKRPILIEGLEIENILREEEPTPFDISLEFDEENGLLVASLLYNVDLYNEKTIVSMADHYQNILGELLTKTNRPIAELEMLTVSERNQIVIDWNNTGVDFPQVCIHDLITDQVNNNPEALAVVCNGNSLTYSSLEKKANQLAHYLRNKGVKAESRVGIYLPRSEELIISLLATLKAGGAYVPLDMSYPGERISYIVNDSDPVAIITLSYLGSQLPEQFQKIFIDTESDSIDVCETEAPVSITNNDSLIYIIYTSGTTGHPKGAMNVHKGIVNYLTYMTQLYQFTSADRIIQLTSFSFDVSVFEIFGTLSYGGTIFLMDDTQMRDPDFICKSVIDYQVTYISCVPTMLRALCESALAREQKENNLRLILPAGEVLWERDVELARKAFGETVKLVNLYGPTECSIIHTDYLVPAALPNGLQAVPIGKPISNARAYVLDNYFHPVPIGAIGELFLGGIGVGRGYWNQPDLTAQQFLPDPFWSGGRMYRTGDIVRLLADGTICFIGRTDNQVKIRGYRVELSEIEAVMNKFPGVNNSVVVLWQQDGLEMLAAYITTLEEDQDKLKACLQTYLADRLPFYMLPSSITVLMEMPLTPNRKIDRRALPRPETGIAEGHDRVPRNDIERRLVLIWKEVLGVEHVGVRDNFFELGGHSLLAVQLLARIQKVFGQSLPLLLLFKNSTVEALATALTSKEETSALKGVVPIQPEGSDIPIFFLSAGLYMRNLAYALGTTRPVYGLHPFEDGQPVYRGSVQETAKIYYQCLIDFYPQGPYLLLGHSQHGYFALELARLLCKAGKKVAFLGLLDTYPPGPRQQAKPRDRLKIHQANLRNRNLFVILKYATLSARRFLTRRWYSAVGIRTIERYERKGKINEVRQLLLRAYKPEPYDGQVMLLSATRRPWYVRADPMERWTDTLTGKCEVVPVQGDHMSILKPPLVTLLADKILSIINSSESE